METIARKQHALTPTPPMGWNSFDCYGCAASEQVLLENLEVMAERLKNAGYNYFVVDNGWFAEYEIEPGHRFPTAKHALDVRIDEYGRYLPSHCYFPKGLQPLIDRTHELGLKFGIHIMRGISRKAVEENLPIFGTPYRAADIANTADTCVWCHYNYGIDMDKPGSQEFYNAWIGQLADWGVDFIKADDITGFPREIEAIVKAIEKCGRDIVLSLSPGGQTVLEQIDTYSLANMLRTTKDVWDNQRDIDRAFDKWLEFNDVRQEGFWLDMDMIPFGHLSVWRPEEKQQAESIVSSQEELFSGKGRERMSGLNRSQMLTFITMRALAASPLFMGGALPTTDEFSFELLTNPDMIACNQNGVMGTRVYHNEGIEAWSTRKKESLNEGWIGIFNRTGEMKSVEITLQELSLPHAPGTLLRNIWEEPAMNYDGTQIETQIDANGVLYIHFIGEK
ncbi:glycoside hydrolase family 27 protein [Paenibacillus sp. Soil750]|uniref:glycoside hydrolase family 27 protein n=1 Tax=Paenibacillus sp. Soil750 TaxID=1736398 RepID=UPI000AD6894F|nr:glycoside hydrolase family 27 protein [Paenibacillus sp. Soil750]